MLADMIEDTFYEVEMPASAWEPANVFKHQPYGECENWKKSGKPLRILREGKLVAELSSWKAINIKENSSIVKLMNPKNNRFGDYTWIPTWVLYTKHYYKLYDLSCGSKTAQGVIHLTKYETKKPQQVKSPQIIIGELGEDVIESYYDQAIKTSDWFDSEKDGTMGSIMRYEVKTIQLNKSTQGFWMSESQGPKLDGVDLLFFIEVPETEFDLAKVYLVINHKNCFDYAYRNDGTRVRNYPLTNCLYQFTIDKDKSKIMFEQSKLISTWRT